MDMKRAIIALPLLTILLAAIMALPAPVSAQAQTQQTPYEPYGPRVDELIIKIFFSPEPEYMALQTGEIDIIDWPLSAAKVEEFKNNPDIVLAEYTELGMFEFDLNNRNWPLSNVHFRKALAYLVDKERIITEVVKGYGIALDSVIGPQWGAIYNPYVKKYEYSPEKAAELLDKAGFVMGPDGWRIDPKTGEKLRELVFVIRADDPLRQQAGLMFAEELQKIGIPVKTEVVDRTVAYQRVMVSYEYDIYTGGWILDRDGTYLYDLYTSYVDVYPEPWSLNYIGFHNDSFDYWAYKMKYASTNFDEYREAAWKAQEIFMDQVPMIPLWSTVGVKAYRAELKNVINMVGTGVNNGWTFLNAYKEGQPFGGKIVYGFKSDIETLNPVIAQWYWDHEVLGKIFDSLIAVDPYDLQKDLPWLAESWDVQLDPEHNETTVTFHLRKDVVWQDGVPFTSEDVKFTIELYQKWSPYWLPMVENIYKVEAPDPHTVVVHFNVTSYLAYRWAGGIYILPKHIWEKYDDPTQARPWEEPHPTVAGLTKLIGTGPFIFKEWKTGEYVRLVWNPLFFNAHPERVGGTTVEMISGAGVSTVGETRSVVVRILDVTGEPLEGAPVKVEVTKAGEVVATYNATYLGAGLYKATIDTSGFSPGDYEVKIKARIGTYEKVESFKLPVLPSVSEIQSALNEVKAVAGNVGTAMGLGAGGLILGIIAIIVAALAMRRR